jgi:hypothetical protein
MQTRPGIAAQSQSNQSLQNRYAVAAQSLRNRFVIPVQSLQNRLAITAQRRYRGITAHRSHREITALSLQNRNEAKADLLCNHFAITAKLDLRVLKLTYGGQKPISGDSERILQRRGAKPLEINFRASRSWIRALHTLRLWGRVSM